MWYRGPWQLLNDAEEGERFEGPAGTVAALDLRPISEQGTPDGIGLFWCPGVESLPSEYDRLGRDWSEKSTGKMRDGMARGKGRKKRRPAGDDILGLILDMVTDGSDMEGENGLKPIVPNDRMQIRLRFGAQQHTVKMRGLGDGHGERVRALLERDLDECPQHKQRKALGFQLRKYGLKEDDWEKVVKDKKRRKRLRRAEKPETDYTDDFARADEDPIAAPWTQAVGTDWEISSGNLKKTVSTFGVVHYNNALSGSDQEVTGTSISAANGMGPAARCLAPSTATHYSLYPLNVSNIRLYKVLSGSRTQIATGTTASINTVPYKIVVSGSNQEAWIDGVEITSATDTSISSGLYAGMAGFNAKKQHSDWAATDGAGVAGILYTQLESTPRGLHRGTFARVN